MSPRQAMVRLARPARSGFSSLEAMLLILLILSGLMALTSTSLTTFRLQRSDREIRTANNAIQSKVEEIAGLSSAMVDDERGWSTAVVAELSPGGRLGNSFAVRGLNPPEGEVNPMSVEVITDERRDDADIQVALGMPRDLDGDGASDNADVTNDAQMLPIVVTTQWDNGFGVRVRRYGFYVSNTR